MEDITHLNQFNQSLKQCQEIGNPIKNFQLQSQYKSKSIVNSQYNQYNQYNQLQG